jgi:hypothetical protein
MLLAPSGLKDAVLEKLHGGGEGSRSKVKSQHDFSLGIATSMVRLFNYP